MPPMRKSTNLNPHKKIKPVLCMYMQIKQILFLSSTCHKSPNGYLKNPIEIRKNCEGLD